MNQEPKSTVDQLLDECFALSKIATPGYKPYLWRAEGGTYSASSNFEVSGYSTSAEALTDLKEQLYTRASSKKEEVQKKVNDLQQQLNNMNWIAEQFNTIGNTL
jgi:hypothetical protein